MGRKFLSSLIAVLTFNAVVIGNADARQPAPPDSPYRQSALVVDARTGDTLSAQNADRHVYPASLTKLMTLYLTFEALENGTLRLDQKLPVSGLAAHQQRTNLSLRKGDTITVEQAIKGLTTQSANDAAIVIAEAIGGSQSGFVRMMNAKAAELGMSKTIFANANGLPNLKQVTTARDMVALSQAHIRDFPQYRKYFEIKAFIFNGRSYPNHNQLMNKMPEIDFGKTGFIGASGFNLVVSAQRGGERIYAAVFGGASAPTRDKKMQRLLNYGFDKAAQAKPKVSIKAPEPTVIHVSIQNSAPPPQQPSI